MTDDAHGRPLSPVQDPARWITLERCDNFRDVGGYPTVDGGSIRWGRLYRCGVMDALTVADLDRLTGEIGVRTVVDLRSPREVAERPDALSAAQGVEHLAISLNRALDDGPGPVPDGHLAEVYAWILAGTGVALAQVLGILADPDAYPVVLHCLGGKDRTGIVTAVALSIAGVDDELIVEDYAASDQAVLRRLESDPQVRRIADHLGVHPELLRARPESMAGLLESVRQEHGSCAALASSLGLTDAQVEDIRSNLAEG